MYVEQLDLPIVPDEVIQEILEKNPHVGNYDFQVKPNLKDSASFIMYNIDLSKLETTWFKDRGEDKYRWALQIVENGTYLVPHTDEGREYAIMYIIETGGNNVETRFYQMLDGKSYAATETIPYTDLKLKHSQVFEKNCWYKISVQDPHSVENLETTRICLARSIPDECMPSTKYSG